MDAAFNSDARALIAAVLEDHPGWGQYIRPYGPAEDAEAEPGSVLFVVPSAAQPTHCLEIAQRGNTIEVAYDCGTPGTRAEQQFIFSEGELEAALAALKAFLMQLRSGQVVIVCEPLGRVIRALRRDAVLELAFFRDADKCQALRAGTVHTWSEPRIP